MILYGVTVQMVRDAANGLVIDATTTPSADAVEDMIARAAAEVASVLDSIGIDSTPLAATDTTFLQAQAITIQLAAADALRSRSRGNPDQARALEEAANRRLDRLMKRPRTAGSAKPGSPNTPGAVASGVRREDRQGDTRYAQLLRGRRM